jgi:hypothetical protein
VTTTAAGLPAWLAPTPHGVPDPLTTTAVAPDWASPPGPPGPVSSAVGATRVPSTEGWRHGLVTAVRIGWVLAVVCYVGLVFERTAPYTAGALAGVAVALGAYARIRWLTARTRRPPPADRPPTVLVVAAAAATVAVVPAAMVGALTVARVAAIVAVSCLTLAAVLLGRRP